MVNVKNLTANQIDKSFLKKVAQKVLAKEKKQSMELSIVLVGEARIRVLNKKYLKRNRATDVLSFNYGNSGEVVICLKEIKKNAQKFGLSFKRELTKVLIHGILHLIGYNHEEGGKEAEEMGEKEQYYLSRI